MGIPQAQLSGPGIHERDKACGIPRDRMGQDNRSVAARRQQQTVEQVQHAHLIVCMLLGDAHAVGHLIQLRLLDGHDLIRWQALKRQQSGHDLGGTPHSHP